LPEPRVWILYLLAALSVVCWSLGAPAMRSLVPLLVKEEQIPAAMALEGIYGNLGAVAGPALGGILIATIGLPLTYGLDVLTFAASLATVWALPSFPPVPDADRAGVRSMLEGLRFVRNRKILLAIFLVDTNAMIFGMPSALFPAIAAHRFHDPALVGYLYMAPAAGALIVSLLSGPLRQIRRQGLGVVVTASLWGVAIAAFGFADRLWLALLLLGIAGLGDQISAILRSVMLYRIAPTGMLGRVSGIEFMQVAAAPSVGNLEAGALASLTSVRFSIVSGGLACIVGCFLLALAFPALVRYDSAKADAET
jgi:MFS family permease